MAQDKSSTKVQANIAMQSGSIFERPTWQTIEERFSKGATLHFLGLLSDGNIHSHIKHPIQLAQKAASQGCQKIRFHCLFDGRDVPDRSALKYLTQLESALAELRASDIDARVASGGGRMHVTMDRYESDWSVVERGYQAHICGVGPQFDSAEAALKTAYENPNASDQYLEPFVVCDDGQPIGRVEDGDALIGFNFRGDRMIQISSAIESKTFSHFKRPYHPDIFYAGMMEYDGDLKIPNHYLVSPPTIENTSGEYIVQAGLKTLAMSETHKFGHVTYFWNGNRSGCLDDGLEDYVEIPSDPTPFHLAPYMRAQEIADKTIEAIQKGRHDYIRINIANGDMIGHTGLLEPTIKACAFVDQQVKRIADAVYAAGGRLMVTADHGNCDDMALRNKDGSPKVKEDGAVIGRTSHTLAAVPFSLTGSGLEHYTLNKQIERPTLANVTTTTLELLGIQRPEGYEASLLKKSQT